MQTNDWTTPLFASIDSMDTSRFLSFLTEDGAFRFRNTLAVVGHAAIRRAIDGLFANIAASGHDLLRSRKVAVS